MAKLQSVISFTGSLGELSAYKMRGSDKIIIRRKGGASKKKIKTLPSFDRTRRLNSEFGGRSMASRWIMKCLRPVKPLADYNIAGPLNALLRPIQKTDDMPLGQRGVPLSKHKHLLQGFPLNRGTAFESMVRASVDCELSRETLSAKVHVPQLIHGINFNPPRHPWYKIIVAMGIVPDIAYDKDFGYRPVNEWNDMNAILVTTETPWLTVVSGGEPTTLELKCDATPPDENFTFVLSVGIAFGNVMDGGEIGQVRHVGSAKVIAVG